MLPGNKSVGVYKIDDGAEMGSHLARCVPLPDDLFGRSVDLDGAGPLEALAVSESTVVEDLTAVSNDSKYIVL
jgi:hypothetical protein